MSQNLYTNKSLIALALGSFSIGMTEFTMMGILPDIAAYCNVEIPEAGYLIALYALGVVVGAPTLVIASSKFPPKKVLLFLIGLFVLFNGLFAIAPSFPLLVFCRFLAGLPHGAFFGVAAVVATKLVPEGKGGQAISIMFTGMTIANLVGVPIGTYIGHHFSFRLTYLFITLCGVATFFLIYQWIPEISANKNVNIRSQFGFFKTKNAWIIIAMIAIGTGGLFSWLSYVAPMVINVTHISEGNVGFIMLAVGLGMVVGNLIGGRLADVISPIKAILLSFGTMAIALVITYWVADSLILTYLMSFLTGAFAFSNSAPLQMLLISTAKGAETLAASAGQAAFNLANTFGAYFGGLAIENQLGYDMPPLVGAAMVLVGLMFALLFIKVNPHPNVPIRAKIH